MKFIAKYSEYWEVEADSVEEAQSKYEVGKAENQRNDSLLVVGDISCDVYIYNSSRLDDRTVASCSDFAEAMEYISMQWLRWGGFHKAEIVHNDTIQATIYVW